MKSSNLRPKRRSAECRWECKFARCQLSVVFRNLSQNKELDLNSTSNGQRIKYFEEFRSISYFLDLSYN